jgi:hypothetical protein
MQRKTINIIREAIRAGTMPESIDSDPILNEHIRKDPDYINALKLKPGPGRKGGNIYLINLLPGS